MTMLLCAASLASCGIWKTNPRPVCLECAQVEADLKTYTEGYLSCLENLGNLKQQLKAERERR